MHRSLLEHLPDGWFAWHSLRVRVGSKFEGEGDFVVAIPNRGILLIEVKGGAIEIRDGQWLQSGRIMDRSPRDQAHRLRGGLRRRLEQHCPNSRAFIAIAAAFPETPFTAPPSEGAMVDALLGQQDMPYLAEALTEMADKLFDGIRPPRDRHWISALHDLWCETWTPVLALGHRTKLRRDELVALDADQLQILDSIEQNARMLVTGGAGTGKTLVARDLYRRLADREAQPLYLCSTSALARALRGWGLSHAWTVREYAARLLDEAKIVVAEGKRPAQWTAEHWELAPLQAATDALPLLDLPHRSLVIDEGQDLSSNDWDLVEALAGDQPLWVFADHGQGFWEKRGVREDLVQASYKLTSRYRCPEPLARFADRYLPEPPPTQDSEALAELRIVRAPTPSAVLKKVSAEITRVRGEGASPGDIAVLVLAGQTRTELGVTTSIGPHPVVRADAEDADDQIIADTFLRFKGLDRPWIIVSELYRAGQRYDVRMHIALTRATVGCTVVATDEQIQKDERLQLAMGR